MSDYPRKRLFELLFFLGRTKKRDLFGIPLNAHSQTLVNNPSRTTHPIYRKDTVLGCINAHAETLLPRQTSRKMTLCRSFPRQFSALVRKNFLTKRRSKVQLVRARLQENAAVIGVV